MKFYYNGQLVRTSKTHQYKYALINTETGKCYACGADRKNPEAELRYRSANLVTYRAVRDGQYRQKDKYHCTAEQIRKNAEKYYGSLENAIAEQEEYVANLKIVELEARA